jgi:hypothetical protein
MSTSLFTFNGDKTSYLEFLRELKARLALLKIDYVVLPERLALLRAGVERPPVALFAASLPNNAANRNANALEQLQFEGDRAAAQLVFAEQLKMSVKFRAELEPNFGLAISTLLSFLSPHIKNIVSNQPLPPGVTNEVIFSLYMTYLSAHYSLNSPTDVLAINTRLQSVRTRVMGVRNAIYVLDSGFAALTGIVVDGVPNAPTAIAKKTFLLNALKDDTIWSSLLLKYSSDAVITYESMVAELNHAVDTNPAYDPFLKESFLTCYL